MLYECWPLVALNRPYITIFPSSCCREKRAVRRKGKQLACSSLLGCNFNPQFPETASVSDLSQHGNSVTHLYHITSHHYTQLQGQTCSLSPSLPSPAFKVLSMKHLNSASCLQECFKSRRTEEWTVLHPPLQSPPCTGQAAFLDLLSTSTPAED